MLPAEAPPAPLAIHAPAPAHGTHLFVGLANPEWLHAGVDGRAAHFGYSLSVGTLALANDVSGSARYFLGDNDGGLFAELGATLIRQSQLTGESPQEWNPMAFVGVGYQLVLGRFVGTLSLGFNPTPLAGGVNEPLFVTNAHGVPRVMLETGFSL